MNTTYWLLTDTHFGHQALCTEIKTRIEGYETKILKNISKVNGGILIFLGDFSWTNHRYWHENFMGESGADKHWFIRGNHDKMSDAWYLNAGWDFVGTQISIRKYGKNIAFTHEPLPPGSYDINIHGHLHTPKRYDYLLHKKNLLLSIEEQNYIPISLERAIKTRIIKEKM